MGKISKALNKDGSQIASDHPSVSLYTEEKDIRPEGKRTEPKPVFLKTKGNGIAESVEINMKNWDERLASSFHNSTGVAEGIRKLRTRILHPESTHRARSVMVLSSDPQEGKSFVCANLGVSIARSLEHQALLVDCDLRRPSLHNLFGLNGQRGLSEYLTSGDANFSSFVTTTGMPKLSILPAGAPPKNPAELLTTDIMSELIEGLSNNNQNCVVLLDTPPFHAASETILLSQLVDKIVLVIRWGKSGRENIKKMINAIGHEKIIGVVFNAFETNILDRRIQGVGYHNYYPNYY